MNKKLLLLALPTLMIMSSCTYLASGTVQKNNLLQEDTLAHEEIFGEATPLILKTPRNAAGDPSMLDRAQPAIGVQYQENDGNISIRFVAAIDIGKSDISDVKAVWKRVFYWSDGTIGKAESDKESLKAYTTLNNKGSSYSIDDFNGATGTYDYFVVYTMTNIPKETYQYCRLNAYLELDDGAAYSRVLSTTVNGDFKFVFNHDSSGYFLTGTINGQQRDVLQHDPTLGDGNDASFISDIDQDDSFIVVHKTNNYFKVYGGSDLGNSDHFSSADGKIRANEEGNFAFYLSHDSQKLYPSDPLVVGNKGYYVRGDAAGGWDDFSYELYQENWENLMIIKNVPLTAEKEFKIANSTWTGDEYNWYSSILGGASSKFAQGSGSNIRCNETNNYDIYITINHHISIEIHSS